MKVAISSTGKNLNSNVDAVFGRCPYFIIVEVKDRKIVKVETAKNTSVKKSSGAGVSAAQFVADKDVNAVISGNIGPRALEVLKQFKIKTYKEKGSVRHALQKFLK